MAIDSPDRNEHRQAAPKRWPLWLKVTMSVGLIAHFGLIALVYFSNNSSQRMPLADELLQKCQPYLIGMGWYAELLPMSLIGYEVYDKPIRIDLKSDRNSRIWTTWIDSAEADSRWRRLCQLIGALAINEDEEGLGQLVLSIGKRGKLDGIEIDQIRIVTKDFESQTDILLYQAWMVPLSDGELTLVPELEPTRSVPVKLSSAP